MWSWSIFRGEHQKNNTCLTFKPQKLASIKFHLIISLHYNTYRSWELRNWSPKMKCPLWLMFKQILPLDAIISIWRTVRRIYMLIMGLKGLRNYSQFLYSKLLQPRLVNVWIRTTEKSLLDNKSLANRGPGNRGLTVQG